MPAPGQSAPCPRPCRFIASLGGAATVVCPRTRAAALPTSRPICNARVPQAIGQSFDWLVPAEAEVLGARLTDRPAAFPLAKLEQRASASVADRDDFSSRLRPRERRHQHLMLGEDVRLGARKPDGTPLLQLPADHILRPRSEAVHLADDGVAGDSDLAGDLAA